MNFSFAAILVWRVSVLEAQAATYAEVLPEHFFLALCKTCDMPLTAIYDDGPAELIEALPAIQIEMDRVRQAFQTAALDPVAFRRRLRGVLGMPGETPPDGVWHRGMAALRLCDLAARLAAGAEAVEPIHLLLALTQADGEWLQVLSHFHIPLQVLRQQALRMAEPSVRKGGQANRPDSPPPAENENAIPGL